jgi:hypothetical protein
MAEHYNFHPHCLHLWAPLDEDPLPDFRAPNGALRAFLFMCRAAALSCFGEVRPDEVRITRPTE